VSEVEQGSPPTSAARATRGRVQRGMFVAVALAVIALSAVAILGFEEARTLVEEAWSWLQRAPAPIFFAVMTLAIMAPLPATAFYVTAGPIYGVPQSLLWIALVLAANALLVHAIGSSVLRPRLEAMVTGRGIRIPRLERPSDQLLFLTVMRVTPGIPYFIQSWAIVLASVDRARFVLISVVVQMFYATGFVVLGRSAFEGRLGGVAFAVAFLVAAGIAARWLHRRLAPDAPDAPEAQSERPR